MIGKSTVMAGLAGAVAMGAVALPRPAEAYWGGGWRGGFVIGIAPPPVLVAPPVVYAPPPVVYAPPPPPVAYAPPPSPQHVWVPPYWTGTYWIPGHWS
jgi:hypothetical protein